MLVGEVFDGVAGVGFDVEGLDVAVVAGGGGPGPVEGECGLFGEVGEFGAPVGELL
ncbi:hypothetical protein GCM10017687_49780 [Streptomyces echinatus]